MVQEFIKKEENNNLIIIFGGWSTDTSFYSALEFEGWDILVVTSYSDLNFDVKILDDYDTIGLFAWSLGVFAATLTIPAEKLAFSVAINGSPLPVSDLYGIPVQIFESTERLLDERNLLKFRKRLSGEKWKEVSELFNPSSNTEELKSELRFISRTSTSSDTEKIRNFNWTRAYIADEDRIFPAINLENAWKTFSSSTERIHLKEPHLPDFKKIIEGVILPTETIGRNFQKRLEGSYDNHATPQQKIASQLVRLSPTVKAERIAEIGPGTGFFSRLIADKLKPEIIDFVELYPIKRLNLAAQENIITRDAELWIKDAALSDIKYDAILSSSVIQWFKNPALFFRICSSILKPSGFILASTFGQDNLNELIDINPYRIMYRSKEELEVMLRKCFREVYVKEGEQIEMKFNTKRELLQHILGTGTGTSSSGSHTLKELSLLLPTTLTYHPIYILARYPK